MEMLYLKITGCSTYDFTPSTAFQFDLIGHGANIPTRQFSIEISRNIQSKSYMVSVTECCWDFQNNALWDTWDEVPYKAC